MPAQNSTPGVERPANVRFQGWIDRLLRAVRFCRRRLLLFWGRRLFTVTSWAGNSNRSPADAPVELILLRLGVGRTVDAVAELCDFHDHGIPPGQAVGRVRSAPHVLEARRA